MDLLAPRHRQQQRMARMMNIRQMPDTDQKAMEMGVFGSHQYCIRTAPAKQPKVEKFHQWQLCRGQLSTSELCNVQLQDDLDGGHHISDRHLSVSDEPTSVKGR